jgi:tRNA(Met) cytidine acetyltransferase
VKARSLRAVFGTREETRAAVCAAWVRSPPGLPDLWQGDDPPEGVLAVSRTDLARRLGSAAGNVVLDLAAGFDPDTLGRAAGLVVAGGTLWLRMPPLPVPSPGLVVAPYTAADVTTRLWARLVARIPAAGPLEVPVSPDRFAGTPEQDALVSRLRRALCAEPPEIWAVLADRGRGKSVALGRAAAGLGATVTAADPAQAAEVLAFAPDAVFRSPLDVLDTALRGPLLVDEAAALSVPLLRALQERAAQAGRSLAFASTVHGYEGHGRGFALRVLPTLPENRIATLDTPIRWAPGDPVEQAVDDVLLLSTRSARRSGRTPPRARALAVGVLDREALSADEDRLRAVFGLLVQAHYRTTPADLQRLLDAPNLAVHAVWADGDPHDVRGVCLVAREGELSPERVATLVAGQRVRGHALAETLAVHSGWTEAATWSLVRSVRIATRPDCRRQGIARRLVEHVHAHGHPDAPHPVLFGTLFGATAGLLSFRRALGYRLVRVGVSRGSRTGEPTAVMVRPTTPAADAGVHHLRRALARDLPTLLMALQTDGLALPEATRRALLADLPEPLDWTPSTRDAAIAAWADGPRPYDTVATAVASWLAEPGVVAALERLSPDARGLIRGRVVDGRSWRTLAAETGMSVPAVMRALRRAVRALRAAVREAR